MIQLSTEELRAVWIDGKTSALHQLAQAIDDFVMSLRLLNAGELAHATGAHLMANYHASRALRYAWTAEQAWLELAFRSSEVES